MRVFSGLILALALVLVGASVVFAQATTTVHKYDAYGFSVSIPSPNERIALQDLGGGGMQEAYTANGLAYVIIASTDVQPKGASCRAVIAALAQIINFIKSKDASIPIHEISATTSQGIPCTGFGVQTDATGSKGRSVSRPPAEISRMYGDNPYVAIALVPIVDRPALLGAVLVVGPPSRGSEIDAQVTQVATSLILTNPSAAAAAASGGSLYGTYKPGTKGTKTPAAPPQPDIKPFNTLTKGQIELVGVVKSTDTVGKSVDMLVGQAVPFGGHGATLSPPRLKRVYVKEIAEGLKEGVLIIVVAKDTGPGKSVTADTLTVMDMSKMGL